MIRDLQQAALPNARITDRDGASTSNDDVAHHAQVVLAPKQTQFGGKLVDHRAPNDSAGVEGWRPPGGD
jgi:hypothetical protein